MLDDSSNERDALCARMERLNCDTERLDAYTAEAQRDAQASPGWTRHYLLLVAAFLSPRLTVTQTYGSTACLANTSAACYARVVRLACVNVEGQ